MSDASILLKLYGVKSHVDFLISIENDDDVLVKLKESEEWLQEIIQEVTEKGEN